MQISRRVYNQISGLIFLIGLFSWYGVLKYAEVNGIAFSRQVTNQIMIFPSVLGIIGIIFYILTPKKNVVSHIFLFFHIINIATTPVFFWLRAGVVGTMNSLM